VHTVPPRLVVRESTGGYPPDAAPM
jgi:hypothetical protein